MEIQEVVAQIHFLRDNPNGFQNIISAEMAIEVLRLFAEEGMASTKIIRRILEMKIERDEVLAALCHWFNQQGRRREFLEAILSLRSSTWDEDKLEASKTASLFRAEDFTWLIDKHRGLVLDPEHPFFDEFNPDVYWANICVRPRIARGDFSRAWNELQNARRGFMIVTKPTKKKTMLDLAQDPENRCYAASNACLEQLVVELFEAMKAAGVPLKNVGKGDCSDRNPYSEQVPTYVWKGHQSYEMLVMRAGLPLARHFREEGDSPYRTLLLRAPGVMALRIAEHLRLEKTERRDEERKKKTASRQTPSTPPT